MLRHELVKLFLVLGVTQAVEEIAKFGLLLLKAPQGLLQKSRKQPHAK